MKLETRPLWATVLILLLLVLLLVGPAWSRIQLSAQGSKEDSPPQPSLSSTPAPGTGSLSLAATPSPSAGPNPSWNPKPYGSDEFSQELEDLRRGEVVFFGSLPFTYLGSTLVYDIARYIDKVAQGDPDADSYAPLFFSSTRPDYTSEEVVGLILVSLGLSLVVTLVDNALVTSDRQEAKAREDRLRQLEEQAAKNSKTTHPPDDVSGESAENPEAQASPSTGADTPTLPDSALMTLP